MHRGGGKELRDSVGETKTSALINLDRTGIKGKLTVSFSSSNDEWELGETLLGVKRSAGTNLTTARTKPERDTGKENVDCTSQTA